MLFIDSGKKVLFIFGSLQSMKVTCVVVGMLKTMTGMYSYGWEPTSVGLRQPFISCDLFVGVTPPHQIMSLKQVPHTSEMKGVPHLA